MDIKGLDLEKINYSSLRIIARRLGIKSPTKMKKTELIEEIRKVALGEKEETTVSNRKGRPCLQSLELENLSAFAPVNLTKDAIIEYSNKFNKLFEEYVKKIRKANESYLKQLLKLSEEKEM